MTNLITRLQSAPGNDRAFFMEAFDLCRADRDHDWRQRVLLLIRDGAFLDAAMMFAVEGWRCHSGSWAENSKGFWSTVISPLDLITESTAQTEANARLALWLKVRGFEA